MELTVKQITSKINSVEKKIDEYTRAIKRDKRWIEETENGKSSCFPLSYLKKSLRENEKKLNKYVAQLAEYKGMCITFFPVVEELTVTVSLHIVPPVT